VSLTVGSISAKTYSRRALSLFDRRTDREPGLSPHSSLIAFQPRSAIQISS